MLVLYPEIKPYARHELAVDEPHVLYADESGSPDGLPVVFVHGGPGSGCDAPSRRFFDPNLYRIVTFDQRGCGRSTPHASLEKNSTWELVADMEACASTWVSRSGCCSAVPGARPCRWPTRRPIPSGSMR